MFCLLRPALWLLFLIRASPAATLISMVFRCLTRRLTFIVLLNPLPTPGYPPSQCRLCLALKACRSGFSLFLHSIHISGCCALPRNGRNYTLGPITTRDSRSESAEMHIY